MYSETVIQRNLDSLHPSITYINSRGSNETVQFQLQETPIQHCQEFVDHFNTKIDYELYEKTVDKGAGKTKIVFKQGYKPELGELIFIENERLMCKYSWDYWSKRYYKISNKENKFEQYSPNRAQRIWDRIDVRLEEKGLAVKRQNAKARQQGSTTHSQGKVQHRIQFYSTVKAITASFEKKQTMIMAGMITDSMKRQPFWLRPQIAGMETGEFYKYDNDSFLNLGTGTAETLSTGTTPTVGHLSEIPRWMYPENAIVQSLLPSIHDNPMVFLVAEATAEGRNNFWHDFWRDNVKGVSDGSYEMYPIFIPNCVRDDTYPTTAWLLQRAFIFEKWSPSSSTIIYASKLRNYILSNPDLRVEFGPSWRLSREKMFWYETEYNKHKTKGTLHIFLQEFPATPEDMFQNSGMTIYPVEIITQHENNAYEKVPDVYKLKGHESELDYSLQPTDDEIDDSKPRIEIISAWNSNIPSSSFELVPVKFDGWDKFNPKNKILIFEHPKDFGYEYGVSVDTSDGLGEKISDNTAIEVIRKGTPEDNDRQVCEFVSPEVPQLQLWPFIMAIATYFSPVEQSLLTIEINKGEEAQNAMMNRGWWNLFLRKDSTIVSENPNSIRRFGFYTGTRSRDALMRAINPHIKSLWIDLFSIPLIDELKDLKREEMLSKIKLAGKSDNRFIALAIGLYALHRDEFLGREQATWEKRKQQSSSRIIIPSMPSANGFSSANTISNMGSSDYSEYNSLYNTEDYEEVIEKFSDWSF
jgi:hypothetical protein